MRERDKEIQRRTQPIGEMARGAGIALAPCSAIQAVDPLWQIDVPEARPSEVPDQVAGKSQLTRLRRWTARSVDKRRVVCWVVIGMLETQLRTECHGAANPEVESKQMLGICCLRSGALAGEVIYIFVTDREG